MAITDKKIGSWTNPVVNEADQPQRTAAEMKAIFDANSNQIKAAFNAVIDEIVGTGGAGNVGNGAFGEIPAGTVAAQLAALLNMFGSYPSSSDIKGIRLSADNKIEVTLDGTTWKPTAQTGDPAADLGALPVAKSLISYTTTTPGTALLNQWTKLGSITFTETWRGYKALLSVQDLGSYGGNALYEIDIATANDLSVSRRAEISCVYVNNNIMLAKYADFKIVYTAPTYELWVVPSATHQMYTITVLSENCSDTNAKMIYYSNQPYQSEQPAGTVVTASMLTLNNNTSGTAAGNIPLLPAATPTDLPLVSDANRGAQTKTAAEMRAILGAQATLTAGTDYATPEQVNGKQSKPAQLTALPASGTALTNNAEYRVSAAVGTYTFAWPDSPFECWLKFTTDATFSITFPAGTTYIGGAPTFKASTVYEMSVKDGVVLCAEVTTE